MPQNALSGEDLMLQRALRGLKLYLSKLYFTKIKVSDESKNTYIIHVKDCAKEIEILGLSDVAFMEA